MPNQREDASRIHNLAAVLMRTPSYVFRKQSHIGKERFKEEEEEENVSTKVRYGNCATTISHLPSTFTAKQWSTN